LEFIFDFLEETIKIEGYNNVNIIKLVIALVGDIVTAFPNNEIIKRKAIFSYIE
jgi:hypothetical protein